MEDLPLESIKLLKEWNTWLVAIQTASIGAIGAGFKDVVYVHGCSIAGIVGCIPPTKIFATAVIVFFGASIITALYLLLALPAIVLRLGRDNEPANIYEMEAELS